MSSKSRSRKKEAPKGLLRENDPEQGSKNPQELEPSAQPESKALKLEIREDGAEKETFKPAFDPYLDGDHGDLDEAMKYFAAKAISRSSAEPAARELEEAPSQQAPQAAPAPLNNSEGRIEIPKAKIGGGLSDVDLLRIRLWKARASHSREAGLALVVLSAGLFGAAFLTSALIFEVGSVSSFVIGLGLLAYEAEPRVKLFPSTSSLIGPLKAVQSDLEAHGVSKARAVFEKSASGEGEVMAFSDDGDGEGAPRYSIPPLGEGLVHAYELELSDMAKLDVEEAKVWLPRVMVEGLGLADGVKMKSSGDEVTTVMEKPFVRALCVQDFMAEGMCQTSGCPLAASVGQALARASGKAVVHHGCTYDPVTQRATLRNSIEQ